MLSLSSRWTSRIAVGAEVLADGVGAQRQRQAGLLLPPDAEIDDQLADCWSPYVSWPSWMIRPASIGWPSYSPRCDGGDDLVERHDDVREILRPGTAAAPGTRVVSVPGTAIVCALQLVDRHRLAGDDHRPVAVAHAARRRSRARTCRAGRRRRGC